MTRDLKLGLLLAVASLFGCSKGFEEQPAEGEEKRCVGQDGNFADDKACSSAASGSSGSWGDEQRARGGAGSYYHYVYVPFGYYGGVGASAGAFMRSTTPGSGHAAVRAGAASTARGGLGATGSSAAESRGGFGATGTAHTSSAGT